MIKIKYFAAAREMAGIEEDVLQQDKMTVQQLLDWVEETYPDLEQMSLQVAVNEEYARKEDTIYSGDVCALIPPVSGG